MVVAGQGLRIVSRGFVGVLVEINLGQDFIAREQEVEDPSRSRFARFADQFGKAWKVFFITADSMLYDFGRLAPLEFAFIDGGHDLETVLNDSRKAYDALTRGAFGRAR